MTAKKVHERLFYQNRYGGTRYMSTDGCEVTPYPELHGIVRAVQSEVTSPSDTSLLRMRRLASEGLNTAS